MEFEKLADPFGLAAGSPAQVEIADAATSSPGPDGSPSTPAKVPNEDLLNISPGSGRASPAPPAPFGEFGASPQPAANPFGEPAALAEAADRFGGAPDPFGGAPVTAAPPAAASDAFDAPSPLPVAPANPFGAQPSIDLFGATVPAPVPATVPVGTAPAIDPFGGGGGSGDDGGGLLSMGGAPGIAAPVPAEADPFDLLVGSPAETATATTANDDVFGFPDEPAPTTANDGVFGFPEEPAPTTANDDIFGFSEASAPTTARDDGPGFSEESAPTTVKDDLFGFPEASAPTTAKDDLFGFSEEPASTKAKDDLFGFPEEPAVTTANDQTFDPFGLAAASPAMTEIVSEVPPDPSPETEFDKLDTAEFLRLFGMDRASFEKLPRWKQVDAKRRASLL